MSVWMQIVYLLGIALAGWLIWRTIKGNPQMFSRANLGKSFTTLGVLALLLIVFVGILILVLRN